MSKAFAEKVLATLRKNGSDINKPHRFDFFVYVPKRVYTLKAADRVRRSGFAAKVSGSKKPCLVLASKTIIPATANLADHVRFFEQIAAAVGGEFDGWETEVVESRGGHKQQDHV